LFRSDMEYAAFMYASAFVFDATYKDVKERLAQFTPEVQNSYFGQILDKQLLVLKNIEVGFAPAEFTVTDKDDRKVSLSDYKGKYVLIYHWGRSEEHTSELQSRFDLVCRLLLEQTDPTEMTY